MVPSGYRLRPIPQQRRRRQPVGRYPQPRRPLPQHPAAVMSGQRGQVPMCRRERGPVPLQRSVQALAADERRGPNDQLRDRLGLVLLDVADGE